MTSNKGHSKQQSICSVCKKRFKPSQLVLGAALRPKVFERVVSEYPEFTPDQHICKDDLARYRKAHVRSLLEDERGELGNLEKDVLESLNAHELLAADIYQLGGEQTLGQRLSDKIASFGGSWPFIICFFSFILVWMAINIISLFGKVFDPYPFILLNLVLSCLAAIQAPIIMMSQNRQEAKDRIRSEHDYKVNLKAELEIRQLHEKMDHVLTQQWERLAEIQQVQIELLEELNSRQKL